MRRPPDRVGELAGADDPAAVKRQNGQDRLAPQAVHRPQLTPDHDVDWSPEDVSASPIPVCAQNPARATELKRSCFTVAQATLADAAIGALAGDCGVY